MKKNLLESKALLTFFAKTFGVVKLRWQLVISLVGASVVPVAIILFGISYMADHYLEKEMNLRMRDAGQFVVKSTDSTKRELSNYLNLFTKNPEFINGLYYASLTGDFGQQGSMLVSAQELGVFDLIEVFGKEGKPLYTTAKNDDVVSAKTHSLFEKSLAGEALTEIGMLGDQLSVVSVTPVWMEDQIVGHLAGVTYLDLSEAQRTKEMSGAEVAFAYGNKVIVTTENALKSGLATAGEYVRVDSNSTNFSVTTFPIKNTKASVVVGLDRVEVIKTKANVMQVLFVTMLVCGAVSMLLGFLVATGIVMPISALVRKFEGIAEGGGDLTQTIDVVSKDEIGQLASSFNRFLEKLRGIIGRTKMVSDDLIGVSEQIKLSSRDVHDSAQLQSKALEESFDALQGIDEAVVGIAASTGELVNSSEESSSATLELGATIEEIAAQMEKLFSLIEEVTSSVGEMSVSSQQVSDNVDALSSATEITASSITELDASIKEIEENAKQTNKHSEEAAQDAKDGSIAVKETIEGIFSLKEMIDQASDVIQDLGSQSSAIGKILVVIDEIADQTSLLALNAAIIAAQAGDQGKSFAVVADEIRELAERTAVSTGEIAAIIKTLQVGTTEAVEAMRVGSERVHEEVERSKAASGALEKIMTSSEKSSQQVRSIVRATQEQSKGSRQITDSMNQVADMLGQIASAIRQQSEGIHHLAGASEAMKEIASQVKLSTTEQTQGSRQINMNMERIKSMVEAIDLATKGQAMRSKEIIEAVSSVRAITEKNVVSAGELDAIIEQLTLFTSTLEEEVGAFEV